MASLERMPTKPDTVQIISDMYIGSDILEEFARGYVSSKESKTGFLKKELLEGEIGKIELPPCQADFSKYKDI